jgi:hypothetical protein
MVYCQNLRLQTVLVLVSLSSLLDSKCTAIPYFHELVRGSIRIKSLRFLIE